ncbi:MAG: RHS repeat protein, partial [Gammaproteobacteria bacterium]|nr:RHS repeat protein [Gammaproteobacteria bacterium]
MDGLRFERFYSYNGLTGNTVTEIGTNWSHTYTSHIEVVQGAVDWVRLTRANGAGYDFYYNQPTWNEDKSNYFYGEPAWISQQDVYLKLEQFDSTYSAAPNGWQLTLPDSKTEIFSAEGKLLSVTDINGIVQTLTYDAADSLILVSSSNGSSLTPGYDADDRLDSITDSSNRSWVYEYDNNGNLEYVTSPDNSVKQYHYEDLLYPYALTGITDERGNRYSTYAYDSEGRANLTTLASNAGRIDVLYHEDGSRTVTNSRNFSSTYLLENNLGSARPGQWTGPDGTSARNYIYDPETNNLLSKTINGVTTQYGDYDHLGQYGYMIEAAGTPQERRIDYIYDSRFIGVVTTASSPSVNPVGSTVVNTIYDDNRNPTSVSITGYKPDGSGGYTAISRVTTYQYTGPYNQLSQIDGPGTDALDITQFRYYADDPVEGANRGRLKEVEDPTGVLVRSNIQYTPTGKISGELRPHGLSISYNYYPGNDRLETMTESDSVTTRVNRWTYLPSGETETITTGFGSPAATTLTFRYDDARRLYRIVDGLGNYIQYTLDTEGNQESEAFYDDSNLLRKQINRVFDAYDRIEQTTQANELVDYALTPDGEIDFEVDGTNVTRDYSYDSLRRLTQIVDDQDGTDPSTSNAATVFDYDVADRLTTVTSPIDGTTTYLYDDLGNLIIQASPDTGTTQFDYDTAGNMVNKIDAKGQTFIYTYDTLNRITLQDAPGTINDITYTYDNCTNGISQLCSVITGDGSGSQTVTYTYDVFGNVTAHQGITYIYDILNRVKEMTYPSGNTLIYYYNAVGQVSQVDLDVEGIITTLASDTQYAPLGPLTELTYGNGLVLNRSVDQAYRDLSITTPGVLELTNMHYDVNGNLTDRSNLLSSEPNDNYTYDALNRVDIATGAFGSQDIDYDKNGNRVRTLVDDNIETVYDYEPASNRLAAVANNSVVLDPNGNTISDGSRTYTYNTTNRLVGINGTITYYYNGLGQRITKATAQENVDFTYDINGQIVVESGTNESREYYYLNGQPLAAWYTESTIPPPAHLSVQVATGIDDAEERSTGTIKRGSKNLKIVEHQEYPGTTGIRFQNLTIPHGAQITSAYLQFTARVNNSGTTAFIVQAEDIGDSPGITTTAYSISNRTTTTASVAWTPPSWSLDDASADQQTPDLSTVIQEVIDRSDWQSGNSMTFTINGSGYRRAHSYNSNPALAPELIVEYTTGESNTTEALYYYHNDHLGTPQTMTDENQIIVWQADYKPFGEVTITTSTIDNNLRFPGQYYDAETGLYYN